MGLDVRVYQDNLRSLTAGVAFKYNGKDYLVLNQENNHGCDGCCFYGEDLAQQYCDETGPKCWNNEKDFIFKELYCEF